MCDFTVYFYTPTSTAITTDGLCLQIECSLKIFTEADDCRPLTSMKLFMDRFGNGGQVFKLMIKRVFVNVVYSNALYCTTQYTPASIQL